MSHLSIQLGLIFHNYIVELDPVTRCPGQVQQELKGQGIYVKINLTYIWMFCRILGLLPDSNSFQVFPLKVKTIHIDNNSF